MVEIYYYGKNAVLLYRQIFIRDVFNIYTMSQGLQKQKAILEKYVQNAKPREANKFRPGVWLPPKPPEAVG